MPDGSVILVEMFGPRLTRVLPDGTKETIAEIAGGPNGAAIGPDGALYLCNNGGCFTPVDLGGLLLPGSVTIRATYIGGRIQRVDLSTAAPSPTSTPSATAAAAGAQRPRVRHRSAASGSPITASATVRRGRAI